MFPLKKLYLKWLPAGLALSTAVVLQLSVPYLVKLIIDDAIGAADTTLLWQYAGLGVAAYAAGSLLRYWGRWRGQKLAEEFWTELRERTFRHVRGMHPSHWNARAAGDMVARVQFDTRSLRNLFTGVFPSSLRFVTTTAATAVALLVLEPVMTLVALAALPVVVLVAWVFRDRVRPLVKRVAKLHGRLYATVSEGIAGLEALRIYDGRDQFSERLRADGAQLKDAQLELAHYQSMLFPLLNFGVSIVLLGVLVAGGHMVIARTLSVGTLVAYYYYVSRSLGPIRGASGIVFGWYRAVAARDRLEELFALDQALSEPDEPRDIPPGTRRLSFQEVSFAYRPPEESESAEDGEAWALREVSFEIAPGGRVVLLGPSGSGKSTTGKLVARLFDPEPGQVSFGGIDLREFESDEWRKTVGFVGQEVFVFNATIEENIRFGALASKELRAGHSSGVADDEFDAAVRVARVDEIVADKPDGLQTEVGEQGARLSGGQKKRIALARALIRRPSVLVIDQLAADLEADLCRAIFGDIRHRYAVSILHVGHRVPAGFEPDRVFWMQRGTLRPHENVVEGQEGSQTPVVGPVQC